MITLDLNFGFGQAFLQAWQAWRGSPQGPVTRRLHHVAVLSQAPTSAEVRARLQASPTPLDPGLVHALLAQWWGLQAGFHRLQFEQQQVVLTLCIGERHTLLRALDFQADEVIWDGQTEDLKQLAKLCRRGTLLRGVEATGQATALLKAVGFVLAEPPHPPLTTATYDPHWVPRRPSPLVQPWTRPGGSVAPSEPVLVIGAGLAGAACARALADRGWSVTVLDAATEPASVGSGLPVGIFGPHYSSDDGRLSQITRNGVRLTWQAAQRGLRQGIDWSPCGVLEHRLHGRAGVGAQASSLTHPEHLCSHEASLTQKQSLGLSAQDPVTWHPYAGWVKPAELVRSLLAHPRIEFRGQRAVHALLPGNGPAGGSPTQWEALGEQGQRLAQASWVILAGGPFSPSLLSQSQAPSRAERMALDAVRGQVSWVETPPSTTQAPTWPPLPVNGHGSLIAHVPLGALTEPPTTAWYTGATFDRSPGQPDWAQLTQLNRTVPCTLLDNQKNLTKLNALLPALAAHNLRGHGLPTEAPTPWPELKAWASIRCTSPDRLPWVGPVDPLHQPGLWLCTAMGARGLSWALLCADLLASWACGEPLPLEAAHARALLAERKFL